MGQIILSYSPDACPVWNNVAIIISLKMEQLPQKARALEEPTQRSFQDMRQISQNTSSLALSLVLGLGRSLLLYVLDMFIVFHAQLDISWNSRSFFTSKTEMGTGLQPTTVVEQRRQSECVFVLFFAPKICSTTLISKGIPYLYGSGIENHWNVDP